MSRNFTFGTAVVPGLALFCAGTNWYYEVTLLTAGLMQIGWATSKFLDVKTTIDSTGRHVKGHGDGCGDDLHSWGYCGSRGLLWHGNSVTMHYESPSSSVDLAKWKAGDVVGCCLRVEEALPTEASKRSNIRSVYISYTLNGCPIAPTDTSFCECTVELLQGEGLYPALSVEAGESVEVNLGTRSFSYLPLNGDGVSLFTPVKDGFKMEELDAKEEIKTAAQAAKESTVTPIPENFFIELDEGPYCDVNALVEAFTPQELAHELRRRGLKAGGSHHERAQRLFLVKGLTDEEIDPKLRMKAKTK